MSYIAAPHSTLCPSGSNFNKNKKSAQAHGRKLRLQVLFTYIYPIVVSYGCVIDKAVGSIGFSLFCKNVKNWIVDHVYQTVNVIDCRNMAHLTNRVQSRRKVLGEFWGSSILVDRTLNLTCMSRAEKHEFRALSRYSNLLIIAVTYDHCPDYPINTQELNQFMDKRSLIEKGFKSADDFLVLLAAFLATSNGKTAQVNSTDLFRDAADVHANVPAITVHTFIGGCHQKYSFTPRVVCDVKSVQLMSDIHRYEILRARSLYA